MGPISLVNILSCRSQYSWQRHVYKKDGGSCILWEFSQFVGDIFVKYYMTISLSCTSDCKTGKCLLFTILYQGLTLFQWEAASENHTHYSEGKCFDSYEFNYILEGMARCAGQLLAPVGGFSLRSWLLSTIRPKIAFLSGLWLLITFFLNLFFSFFHKKIRFKKV